MKLKAYVSASLIMAALSGCNTSGKENHRTHGSNESGVPIEVMLKGGGTAVLVCPKFASEPMRAHGRECYLDRYDKKINL